MTFEWSFQENRRRSAYEDNPPVRLNLIHKIIRLIIDLVNANILH